MQKQFRASITVYFSLALVMSSVLILCLAEAARLEGLKADAQEWTNLTVESLFAGYQPFLLEEYDMFFLDGSFGTGRFNIETGEEEMEALLYENLQSKQIADGINLYRMRVNDVEIMNYTLATDQKGQVFEARAAESMKQIIGQRAAKKILEEIQRTRAEEGNAGDPEQSITDAEQALLELKQQENEQQAEDFVPSSTLKGTASGFVPTESAEVVNPLDAVKPVRQQGVLSLVIPEGKTVSEKSMNVDNSLLKRECCTGTGSKQIKNGWYERILMQEFIKPYVGNFLSPSDEGALSYGLEYLICGKNSDSENLKGTVNRLLLLREAVNYLYLQTDETKKAEALATAAALAGVSANPAVISVVKQGILAAWAYAESVCDVKALLSGGKVPLKKTAENWNTGLSNLGSVMNGEYRGSNHGLSYENYLNAFLYEKADQKIAYRSMDLMEQDMRQEERYADIRMDYMIADMQIQADYDGNTIFSGIFGEDTVGGYQFVKQAGYGYK